VSTDTAVLAILLGGMAGKGIAMLMNARDARKREQDRKRLERVLPPARSVFWPWNQQGRGRSAVRRSSGS
jgi:surface antigen